MQHIRRNDHIKALVRIAELQNVFLLKGHIAVFPALFFGPFQHLPGKIRRDNLPAFPGDDTGQKAGAAGAFQHLVRGRDKLFHHSAQFSIRLFIDAVGKDIIS